MAIGHWPVWVILTSIQIFHHRDLSNDDTKKYCAIQKANELDAECFLIKDLLIRTKETRLKQLW